MRLKGQLPERFPHLPLPGSLVHTFPKACSFTGSNLSSSSLSLSIFVFPYLYSRYRTGTSLQLRLMWRIFSNAYKIYFFCMSLHCKLVPVPYREYELFQIEVLKKNFNSSLIIHPLLEIALEYSCFDKGCPTKA